MSTQDIVDKLEECNHFDADNRQMAAMDLVKCLQELSEKQSIEEALEKRVCSAFIKHLNDKNLNVQTNAVRSIQLTAGILKDNNLIMIAETLANMVTDPNGTKEVRDVYSLAIRSTITQLNNRAASKLIRSVFPKLQAGLSRSDDITEECLEIIAEIFRRFAAVFESNKNLINKDQLVSDIGRLLHHRNKAVSKKASQCLGLFAVILSQRQLDNLVKDLRARLQQLADKDDLLTILQSLSHITRNVGQKLGAQCTELIQMLSVYPVGLQDAESVEQDNDIAEASLASIENLVKKNPAQAKDNIERLYKLCTDCIRYDPNFAGDVDEDEEMGEEDDEGWGSDDFGADEDINDDDTAWKVRKSSVRIIDGLATSCASSLKNFWALYVDLLVERFAERDNAVKCDVLHAFQKLIKASVYAAAPESSGYSLRRVDRLAKQTSIARGPNLARQGTSSYQMEEKYEPIIRKLLKYLPTKHDLKVRVAVMKTLSVLSMVMLDQLESHYAMYIPYIKGFAEEGNNDLITFSLQILKRAFYYTDDPTRVSLSAHDNCRDLCEFLGAVIQMENQSKLVSDALHVTGNFVKQLVDIEGGFQEGLAHDVAGLYNTLLAILSQQNIAQEVKQSCIVAMAKFVTVTHKVLNQNQIDTVFAKFSGKLNAELTRESALRAMNILASNPQIQINLKAAEGFDEKLVQLLSQAQRSVQLWTLELIDTLLVRVPQQLAGAAPHLVQCLGVFITDKDIQRASAALRCSSKLLAMKSANADGLIQQAITLAASSQIQNKAIVGDLTEFFTTATQSGIVGDKAAHILMEQSTLQSRACAKMSAIVVAQINATGQIVPQLLQQLEASLKTDADKVIAVILVLGEIGTMTDMSKIQNIITTISSLFSHENDQIRQAAAICLGSISIGNTNFFVEKVFALVAQSEANTKYMYMSTIREIINIKPECLSQYLPNLLPLYLEQARSDQGAIVNIVSESIGKLYIVSPGQMENDLLATLRSNDLASQNAVTKSFRYSAFKNSNAKSFARVVPLLVQQTQSPNIDVKLAALEALSVVASNKALNALLQKDMGTVVGFALKETPIDATLVETIDLGPFKHTVDKGAPIRKAAFSLLQNLTEAFRSAPTEVIAAATAGIADTSEDVQLLCLVYLNKLLEICPMMVLAQLEAVVAQFNALFTKMTTDLKKDTQTERQLNLLRGILRVSEALQKNPEAMQNPTFSDWFSRNIIENVDVPAIRELYEKIVSSSALN